MDTFNEFFEINDVYKALLALAAGLILGFEREMKDKSAGLKTISVITVGSALFALLSQNFSGTGDNFAIAAGVISGIGFLGAGVIFKEGFSIYGLTTAGVIWVAAAVGMAIGFGEFYIAAIFLAATLIVVYGVQFFGRYFMPNFNSRNLEIEISAGKALNRALLLDEIGKYANHLSVTQTEKKETKNIVISADIHIENQKISELEDYLLTQPDVVRFKM